MNASPDRAGGAAGYGYSYHYQYHYTDGYAADDEPARPLPKKG